VRHIFRGIIIASLIFLSTCNTYGYEDGFTSEKTIEGGYFIIRVAPQVDITLLAQQLNIGPADKLLAGRSGKSNFSSLGGLADMVDIFFLQVSDILDMHVYSFKGDIKVCRDYQQLNQVYNNIFNKDLGGVRSFYVQDSNAIYLAQENFRKEILGHEIAHAIISQYFVVAPPVKVAEILAGYVEYQLRKTIR
jgi:hypothetical protein